MNTNCSFPARLPRRLVHDHGRPAHRARCFGNLCRVRFIFRFIFAYSDGKPRVLSHLFTIAGTNPYSWTLTDPRGGIILNKCYNTLGFPSESEWESNLKYVSWNALSSQIRDPAISINIFRQSLKTSFQQLFWLTVFHFTPCTVFLSSVTARAFVTISVLLACFKCLFIYLLFSWHSVWCSQWIKLKKRRGNCRCTLGRWLDGVANQTNQICWGNVVHEGFNHLIFCLLSKLVYATQCSCIAIVRCCVRHVRVLCRNGHSWYGMRVGSLLTCRLRRK